MPIPPSPISAREPGPGSSGYALSGAGGVSEDSRGQDHPPPSGQHTVSPAAAAAVTGGIALVVLLGGWILDIPSLRTVFGVSNAMAPSTAIAFLLCAAGLWMARSRPPSGGRRAAVSVLAGLATVPAALKLGEFVLGWPPLFDLTLNARDPGAFPGEMAVPTALAFLLLGPAIALLDMETKRGWRPAQTMTLLGMTLPLLGVVGRIYGVPAAQRFVGGTVVMALHTSLVFLLLAGGIMRSRPSAGVMRMFTDGGKAGTLLRYLVPSMALVAIVAGWLRLLGQRAGWYDVEFGATAFVVFTVALLTALVLRVARKLYRLELDQRKATELQRSVLASIGDAVAITDARGRIVSVNPALEALGGWSEGEVRGRDYEEVFVLLDGAGARIPRDGRLLQRAMVSGQVVTSRGYETSLVRRGGEVVPVSVTASAILGRDREVMGGVEVIRDVSHQREVDQLKSSLISTVSHELRTPLTMIQGFSEILLAKVEGDEDTMFALQQINGSSERLSRLIADLLSVSRIESGRLEARIEPVSLETAVREATHPFAADRDVRVVFEDHGAVALADRDKLFQVLTNLLSNAVKYSDPHTPVTVRVAAGHGMAEVSVEDQGMGMTEEDLARLFQKFFRSDRTEVHTTPGTGLGLYITKNLLELQGGSIRAASTPGRGTTMTFTLPLEQRVGPGSVPEAKGSAQVGR